MLKVFCQFLHGEGDFVRHLKKMGYVVEHVQSYIDEFDFHVSNLAVDLRDGVRLTRLMEVVTGEWGLAIGLRVPAVSRLQKIFNTKRALERLEADAGPITLGSNSSGSGGGGGGSVTPKDIVDGDRHATLRLLWFIITRYSLSALLDRDALAREAQGVGWEESAGGGSGDGGRRGGGGGDEELLSALLVWCQAVCHGYGVPVWNFTTSFADGRALCLLLHYYHPRV
ncbi:unnamed protein product, partial [Ectocarpus sp. 12 AP-2014]